VLSAGPTPHQSLSEGGTFTITWLVDSPASWRGRIFPQAFRARRSQVEHPLRPSVSKFDKVLDGCLADLFFAGVETSAEYVIASQRRRVHDEPAAGRPDPRRQKAWAPNQFNEEPPSRACGPARLSFPHLYFLGRARIGCAAIDSARAATNRVSGRAHGNTTLLRPLGKNISIRAN